MTAMKSTPNPNTLNHNYWWQRHNKIVSNAGGWRGGEDVDCQGYSLINDLIGNVSYMQLHILNCTGKLLPKNQADWIEINFMGLSYPDSRIWCNQISALAADNIGSPAAALCGAVLGAESRAYGGSKTSQSGMEQLKKLYDAYKKDDDFAQILQNWPTRNNKPMIMGFARPVDKADERLAPYQQWQEKLHIPVGKYVTFAMTLSDYLFQHYQLAINSGGYSSAFLLDCGFTPQQGYLIKTAAVASGALACYVAHSQDNKAHSFIPLTCNDISYSGPKKRSIK